MKHYYHVIKPGIVRANVITALAGFLFASKGDIDLSLLSITLFSTSLVVASGCIFNNILDRNIDKVMERTKQRPIPTNKISISSATMYATVLGVVGLFVLYQFTNSITFWIGVISLVFYVIIYGYAKRVTSFSTEIGTISGASSILAGYTAVSGKIDITGLTLFSLMVIWQLPHFYAISIFRKKDYKKAKLPVISVIKSDKEVKARILISLTLLCVVLPIPFLLQSSLPFLVLASVGGIVWLIAAFRTYKTTDSHTWAKKNFGYSLIIMLSFSLCLALSGLLA